MLNAPTITRVKKFGVIDRDKSIHQQPGRSTPDWAKYGIIYEVYPRSYSQEGTFQALAADLTRIKALGVTILWLMPIFPIGHKNRKGTLGCPYSIRDYFEVNPEYGNKLNFKHLVDEIHNNGMRIIIDMVANHAANDHVAMKDHPDWFVRDKSGQFTRRITDWSDVTDFNYNNPELRKYMKEAILYWVNEVNIDGYRCDVAGMVPEDFWIEVRQDLDKIRPDIFLLAEWEDPQMHLFTFDATYDWILYYKYLEVCQGKVSPAEIIDLLIERHQEFPQQALRLRFIENHDKNRATATFGSQFSKLLATFIFTIDGIPLIYNGQEIGERNYLSLFEKAAVNWNQPGGEDMYQFYKFLISLRKENPIFVNGNLKKIVNDESDKVITFSRTTKEGRRTLVAINFSSEIVRFKPHFPLESQSVMIHTNSRQKLQHNREKNYVTIAPFDGIIVFSNQVTE